MTLPPPALALGRPLFADPLVAATAAQSIPQAWQSAAAHGAASAARQTSGNFAVAWGGGHAEGSALAIDRFAMQTLCWTFDQRGLRFAPTATELAGPAAQIDPQALFDYLFFHVVPAPRTIFKGVYRLPPGCCLTLEQGLPVVRPYWQPQFEPVTGPDFASLRTEFLGLLRSAVAGQLDGSKPACFLSGGTDSSTVAGMIREVTGQPAAAYSIGFEADGYDEMEYARLAAKHFGAVHREYYVTPADLVQHIPRVATSYDQPFGNSSALPAYCCALMARADGVTRILAGDGGDELFGGNLRYAQQRVFRFYDHLPAALRSRLIEPWALSGLARSLPGVRKVASYVAQARLGLPARLETYNLLRRMGIERILTPAFLASVDVVDTDRQQAEVWQSAQSDSPLNRHLAFDWRYTLAETDLTKVRGTTGLAGLAAGFPMLDQRMVDFSMALPTDYKLRGVQLRWFFKEALRGFLPDPIIRKKKQGFGLPFGPWAVKDPALRALATDSLHSLAGRGIVQKRFIEDLLAQHLPAHPGYYGEMVWILMMLEQWLQGHAPGYSLGGPNPGRMTAAAAR